jgi:hypothetical protein
MSVTFKKKNLIRIIIFIHHDVDFCFLNNHNLHNYDCNRVAVGRQLQIEYDAIY